jgi:hypothetical protein
MLMPNSDDIQAQQKLLMACRRVLAAYLEQIRLWDAHDLPEPIHNGMRYLQDNIREIKATLRAWKVLVEDQPDDEVPINELADQIAHERELLKIHRQTLVIEREQKAQFDERDVPSHLVRTIQERLHAIKRIKAMLRGWNVSVEDLPGEN